MSDGWVDKAGTDPSQTDHLLQKPRYWVAYALTNRYRNVRLSYTD